MNFLYALAVLTILQGIYTLIDGLRAARYMRSSGEVVTTKERWLPQWSILRFGRHLERLVGTAAVDRRDL